ncbi:hypothetical protein MBLNU459_g6808t1 [Dothideomycetes sp. NU459]
MASLEYTTLDVFTTTKYAGNPLAVVSLPSSVALTQAQKQAIAREFQYSETTFVHDRHTDPATGLPTWRVDIFTVDEELPFAGHPTIGTACHVLRALPQQQQQPSSPDATAAAAAAAAAGGRGQSNDSDGPVRGRFVFKAGVLDLALSSGGEARATVPHNVHLHAGHDFSYARLAAWQPGLAAHLAGHRRDDDDDDDDDDEQPVSIAVVSPVRGMNFVMVGLPDLAALGQVGTTGTRATARLDEGWDEGPVMVMFYVRVSSGPGRVELRTRMVEGSFEDPATGSASCGLAAMLAMQEKLDGRTRFDLVQGVEMGRRSEIGVELVMKDGQVATMELIGKAVPVMQGKVFYE